MNDINDTSPPPMTMTMTTTMTTNINETTDLVLDYCGESAWMCEILVEKMMQLSEDRDQNMSDIFSDINKKGKPS